MLAAHRYAHLCPSWVAYHPPSLSPNAGSYYRAIAAPVYPPLYYKPYTTIAILLVSLAASKAPIASASAFPNDCIRSLYHRGLSIMRVLVDQKSYDEMLSKP